MQPRIFQYRHWRLARGLAFAFLILLAALAIVGLTPETSRNVVTWILSGILLIGAVALALRAWHRFEMTDDWVRRINNHIYHGTYD